MEEVTIVDLPMQLVLGARKKGSYKEIAKLIGMLWQHAASKNAAIAGAPIYICHEQDGQEAMEADRTSNADLEVALPIAQQAEETAEIKCYYLPGGKMAKIVHKGPYEQCKQSYDKLFSWVFANGKKIAGPTREVYLNDPKIVNPEEILTEIYSPIE